MEPKKGNDIANQQFSSYSQGSNEMSTKAEGCINTDKKVEKCSICLGAPMFDEATLDGCLHKFCYPCITEWIKLRPICPMCKRPVAKVIHQVRNDENNEEFFTEEVTSDAIQRLAIRERIEADSARPLTVERAELVHRIRHLQRLIRVHDDIFSKSQMSTQLENDSRRHDYVERINRYQMLLDNWERPRREIISDPTFRVLVYELRLHRVAVVSNTNVGNRRAGISPQYFRNNEEYERPRISEFVRRELNAIIPATPDLELIVEHVYNLAKCHQIMSPLFSTYLCHECFPLAKFADHFVELLYEFVVSAQDLALFDQNSEYISRAEYRRRLTSINAMLFGNTADDDDIQVESENMRVHDGNRDVSQRPDLDEGMSPSHLHFVSVYTDALISLRRFLLLLETTDEVLPPNEERALSDTIEEVVRSYVQYRLRIISPRESHNQPVAEQNSDQRREIVISDSDNDDEQDHLNAGGESSSRSALNRRRTQRLLRRRHLLMRAQLRRRTLRPLAGSIRHRYHSGTVRDSGTLSGSDQIEAAVRAVRALREAEAAVSSGQNAVIDLENSPAPNDDDDVMVVGESLRDAINRNSSDNDDDDVVIEDDSGGHDEVVIDEEDNA